jgi:hypothetical protein
MQWVLSSLSLMMIAHLLQAGCKLWQQALSLFQIALLGVGPSMVSLIIPTQPHLSLLLITFTRIVTLILSGRHF